MTDPTNDNAGADAPRRRSRRWLRAGVRALLGPLVLTALAGAVLHSAGQATSAAGDAQPVAYWEECHGEGCSNEEIKELWNSFQQECFVERCWTEEVFELSGGVRRHDMPYYTDTRVDAMFEAFRTRLGKQFQDPAMKQGPTDDAWNWLVQKLDGRVIKTPRSSCDPYCG